VRWNGLIKKFIRIGLEINSLNYQDLFAEFFVVKVVMKMLNKPFLELLYCESIYQASNNYEMTESPAIRRGSAW